jgi:hypothetical protein
MGYGPSPAPKLTWSQVIFPEHGTYMEYKKLKAAEAEQKRQEKAGGESLMTIPRGQHKALDQFDDLLETGAAVAKNQRKWLVGIPCTAAMACGGTLGYVAVSIFSAGIVDGLPAAEVVSKYTTSVQAVIVLLCWAFILMLASLSPTNIKGIYYTNIGYIIYFLGCGGVICPFGMPLILPDSTGTVYTLWMICGMVKCFGVILTLIWAVLTQPPRKCLRVVRQPTPASPPLPDSERGAAAFLCTVPHALTKPSTLTDLASSRARFGADGVGDDGGHRGHRWLHDAGLLLLHGR